MGYHRQDEPGTVADDVEVIERMTGKLMRAVHYLSAVKEGTSAEGCVRLIEQAEEIVNDIDWEAVYQLLKYNREDR